MPIPARLKVVPAPAPPFKEGGTYTDLIRYANARATDQDTCSLKYSELVQIIEARDAIQGE